MAVTGARDHVLALKRLYACSDGGLTSRSLRNCSTKKEIVSHSADEEPAQFIAQGSNQGHNQC